MPPPGRRRRATRGVRYPQRPRSLENDSNEGSKHSGEAAQPADAPAGSQGRRRRRPAQVLPVLPRQGRVRRLQGHQRPAQVHLRPRQDPLAPDHRRLPSPPEPDRTRGQARPRAGAAALRRRRPRGPRRQRPPAATAIATATASAMPQAILLQDVEQLGERGTVVDVSKGYLRNYLIPRKLAAAGHQGRDRGRRAGARRPPSARWPQATQRAQESAAVLNRRSSRSRTRRATTAACSARSPRRTSWTRSRTRAASTIDRRKVHLDEPIRTVGTRMVDSRSATASSRRSRPWSSSRSSPRTTRPAPASAAPRPPRGRRVRRHRVTRGCTRSLRRPTCVRPRRPRLGRPMTLPTAQRHRRRADRAAAEPRGRAVGARRRPALRHGAVRAESSTSGLRRRTSTASGTATSTGRCSTSTSRASRWTRSRVTEHLKQARPLDAAGGAAGGRALAGSVPAVGNVRQYAQIVRRTRCCAGSCTPTHEIQAQRAHHEARPRDLVDMAERAILEVAHEDRRKDFRSIERAARRRARQAAAALAGGQRRHRHPVRLRGPRRRSPAGSSPAT